MPARFAMVVLEVRDLARTIAFYRLLGMDVPEPVAGRRVAICRLDSGISFVFTEGFAAENDPTWAFPAADRYQQMLEFVVEDDAAVDAEYAALTQAGHHGRRPPGRTTGPYAAMVDDPDGNVVLITSDPAGQPERVRSSSTATNSS